MECKRVFEFALLYSSPIERSILSTNYSL